MTTYRCHLHLGYGDEDFSSLSEAQEYMERFGFKYFDSAWCKHPTEEMLFYIPKNEDEEDYRDDDGAYLPAIVPVEDEEDEEDEE